MKNINIGDYTVEAKAKMIFEERNSKDSLYYFLNELSMVYKKASEYEIEHYGANVISRDYKEKADALYKMLKELGVYDK